MRRAWATLAAGLLLACGTAALAEDQPVKVRIDSGVIVGRASGEMET